ncbi:hypothetical protein GWN42_24135 [candidate division KSB1 bacterium]|nr:hypothetical protein [candidate division KSB1 bacterium]
MKRYKNYMYKVILNRCVRFKHPRVKQQLSETVNDIFMEVIAKLTNDACKILKDIRKRDSENAFLAWLGVICNRTAYTQLKKITVEPIFNDDLEDFKNFISQPEPIIRCQLYEDFVKVLRSCDVSKHDPERDIHVFKLYIWAGFSKEMIQAIPCFSMLGDRVVDNVIHRMRDYLRENRALF